MTEMNIKPAFRYRLVSSAKSTAIFFAFLILVTIGIISIIYVIASRNETASGTFSSVGIAAMIFIFILGICTIREDLRLMLQNGVGRRTIFSAELLVILSVSLLLAVGGELLIAVGQFATLGWPNFCITDIFQQIYFKEMGTNLSLTAHIASIACFFGLYICANLAGMFLSLLFYRLNKVWTMIVAIGTPLLLIFGLPIPLFRQGIPYFLSLAMVRLVQISSRTPWTLLVTFLVTAALIATVNWLMLRRVPVKPIK